MHVPVRTAVTTALLFLGAALPAWADGPATTSASKPAAKTSTRAKPSRTSSSPTSVAVRREPAPCPEGYSCKTGASGQRYRWKPGFC